MTWFLQMAHAMRMRCSLSSLPALRCRTAHLVMVMATLLGVPIANAQGLDDLEILRRGADAVIRISFSARVQYLRHAPYGSSGVEIFIQVVSGSIDATIQEHRSLPATPSFPGVSVTIPVQANARQPRLIVEFTKPLKFRLRPVGDRAIEIIVAGAAKDVTARRAPRAPDVAPEIGNFAIRLQSFPTGDMSAAPPVPGAFQDYTVFTGASVQEGRTHHELLLGYFPDAAAAEVARRGLLPRFPEAAVIDLMSRREQTLRATAPAMPAPPLPVTPKPAPGMPSPALPAPSIPAAAAGSPKPSPAPDAGGEIEPRAAELLLQAKAALGANNNELAIDLFNQLLVLPPNRQSREAQELIGVARERNGELAKAKAEYDLYMRLFPDGEGTERVRKRLAALQLPAEGTTVTARRFERGPIRTVQGSLSQYYFGGKTRVETAFNTPTSVDRASFSAVDQSALVTSADLNGRYRSASSDQRLVFRDVYTASFLEKRPSFNRLNAAYWDYKGLDNALSSRIGRQSGLSGGLPGRFDGGVAGYGLTQKLRLNAVGGVPVEYPQLDAKRVFYGLNLDFDGIGEHWHGNVFALNQTVDNILDRRAVGTEVRYLQNGRSVFSYLDYDTSYATLNTAMIQGSWQTAGQSTFNALFDRRKAPTLTTTNAIFGQGTTSIMTLLQTMSEEQIRQQARDVTATATQALIGFTTPLTQRWQFGADARYTNVGALPATTINTIPVPAQPATGNIWSYSIQTIGTNLLSNRDSHVLSGTLVRAPTFDGWLAAYNHLTFVTDNWTVQPSVRYYSQTDILDTKLSRVTPGLRLAYRVGQMVSLEADALWERSKTVGATNEDVSTRTFFSVGYRADF